MKLLDGLEVAGFIKERQAKQVRALRQSWKVVPKLAVIQTIDDPVIDTYVRMKQKYAEDILIDFELHKIDQEAVRETIEKLNEDSSVFGIIIQLPLADKSETEAIVQLVDPGKDVDGLGKKPLFDPATPMAINWLLTAYNVELHNKKIAIVGNGRLVGQPLMNMWQASGYEVTMFDKESNLEDLIDYDVIVSATGAPRIITSEIVKYGTVLVDAGTAAEHGVIVGDIVDEVRSRDDVTITPQKGGVGPLTIVALFDNVITSARRYADNKGQQDLG